LSSIAREDEDASREASSRSAPGRVREAAGAALKLVAFLFLRTDTHAYCGSLAFFALVGFYPFCAALLWIAQYRLQWAEAVNVIHQTLNEYYPEAPAFLLRNLELSVQQHGATWPPSAIGWILLGAAGIFIPLENAFNQIWGAREHRPYWKNQCVGLALTTSCCALAVLFVAATAMLQRALSTLPQSSLLEGGEFLALRALALCFSVVVVFLFYKFLPNVSVSARSAWLAAVFAGIVADGVRGLYHVVLPRLDLRAQQGPFYVSLSFVLLAYSEAFVLLAGAYLAARAHPSPD
jgi:uncharacterized BrkB/YihY/UPF0761 family membrane protein